ncbi:hypothetical protein VMCG_03176 [Cytospora schulzeri]|uniref:Uncharacterized protein n=1 Tax=Cytospora schulzeri TaxID=448051 RepID=A0A423WXS6_9PEZI|nr:hypothetical protein VMCG_03176 [Valsa malicola]
MDDENLQSRITRLSQGELAKILLDAADYPGVRDHIAAAVETSELSNPGTNGTIPNRQQALYHLLTPPRCPCRTDFGVLHSSTTRSTNYPDPHVFLLSAHAYA